MPKMKYSYLLLAFIFLFFYNGRWILPIASFIAPLFLIRFLRCQKPFSGFLWIVAAGWISNLFIWKGMLPMSGFFYYFIGLMMSVFSSLPFLIDRIYYQKVKGILSTFVFPSTYVIMEFIVISTNPSGSYGTLAHTQTSLPLLQFISITGIWGLTFLIMWTASIINWLWDNSFEKSKIKKGFLVFGIPFLLVILYGQIRMKTNFEHKTVRIASINVTKMEIRHLFCDYPDSINEQINNRFLDNCHIAAMSNAKIVFGIEIMLNMASDKEGEYLEKAKLAAKKDSLYIGLPLLIYPKDNPGAKPMNKITWISPKGEILFTYYKSKPTPGEGDYGDGMIKYFDSPYGRIGSAICFDMDFPFLINQVANMDIMLVPGNDWREIAPYHTYVASFRAIEQGFNLVRAASRGLSASFNYKGQLISSQNYFATDDIIFYSDVATEGYTTIYSILGNYFVWSCILFFLSVSIILLIRK